MPPLLGISGSLRAGSHKTAPLNTDATLLPDGASPENATLHRVALHGGDAEAREAIPAAVHSLKDPAGSLLAFLGSTRKAAASHGQWDRTALEGAR